MDIKEILKRGILEDMVKLATAVDLISDVAKLHKRAFYESDNTIASTALTLHHIHHDLKLVHAAMKDFRERIDDA